MTSRDVIKQLKNILQMWSYTHTYCMLGLNTKDILDQIMLDDEEVILPQNLAHFAACDIHVHVHLHVGE